MTLWDDIGEDAGETDDGAFQLSPNGDEASDAGIDAPEELDFAYAQATAADFDDDFNPVERAEPQVAEEGEVYAAVSEEDIASSAVPQPQEISDEGLSPRAPRGQDSLDFEAETFPTAEVETFNEADSESDFWDSLAEEVLDELEPDLTPAGSGATDSGVPESGATEAGTGDVGQPLQPVGDEPTEEEIDESTKDAEEAQTEAVEELARLIAEGFKKIGERTLGLDVLGVNVASAQRKIDRARKAGAKATAIGKSALRKNKHIVKAQRAIKAGGKANEAAKALSEALGRSTEAARKTQKRLPTAPTQATARATAAKPGSPLRTTERAPRQRTQTYKAPTTPTAPLGRSFRATKLYGGEIARGDDLASEAPMVLASPIETVSDDGWTEFVRAMAVAHKSAVSDSNGLGMFEMPPRRLADLGLVTNLHRRKSPKSGRTVWVGDFTPPVTAERFLKDAGLQYRVFVASMTDYAARMKRGEIVKPDELSLSAALAILHRAGPKGLDVWEHGERFKATEEACERVEGLF